MEKRMAEIKARYEVIKSGSAVEGSALHQWLYEDIPFLLEQIALLELEYDRLSGENRELMHMLGLHFP